jgi:hypothetical protein
MPVRTAAPPKAAAGCTPGTLAMIERSSVSNCPLSRSSATSRAGEAGFPTGEAGFPAGTAAASSDIGARRDAAVSDVSCVRRRRVGSALSAASAVRSLTLSR